MSSILVLTGPPGIGKTTVARLVADALPRSVHLEADAFWRFIRSDRAALHYVVLAADLDVTIARPPAAGLTG